MRSSVRYDWSKEVFINKSGCYSLLPYYDDLVYEAFTMACRQKGIENPSRTPLQEGRGDFLT
jgi:hypothetical protein